MKYIFVSTNEDLESGLLQSQFVRPINDSFKYEYEIVSINKPFHRRYRFVKARQINVLIPQRVLAYNAFVWLYIPWALFVAIILYTFLVRRESSQVRMVARGYLSGLVCSILKLVFRVPYVFDPRSLYPLESITANLLSKGSIAIRFWLYVERYVVSNAEKTVCVSHGMVLYYRRRYHCKSTVLIPCFSAVENPQQRLTSISPGAYSEQKYATSENLCLRSILGIPIDRRLLLYYGSLNNGWNNIDLYAEYIESFPPDSYHVVIISQDCERIRSHRLGHLSNVTVFTQDSLPERLTLSDCFYSADFGIIFMGPSHDWFTRLGVKFAEYTNYGLPVLTNKWVGDAARLIKIHGLLPSQVLSKNDYLPQPPTSLQREAIVKWAAPYFAPSNINKMAIDRQ